MASYFYVLLAVNRFLVVVSSPKVTHMFQKIPISLWLLLGLLYGLAAGIGSKPLPFNSRAFGGIYVPAIEDLKKVSSED
ncbi:unnamed protein product, partial [Mesorhabditis belari]|uniref:Uncharacterized protein n=1 Tax=Mesorhabditis belari TaxID=2138241 RepID=A0AAF3EQU8_9BILA